MQEILQYGWPALGFILTIGMPLLTVFLIRHFGLKGQEATVIKSLEDSVPFIYNTLVRDWKASNEDGHLTPDQKDKARSEAKKVAFSSLVGISKKVLATFWEGRKDSIIEDAINKAKLIASKSKKKG